MDKTRINAYWQFIQKLIESPNSEQTQIVNAHSELLDPGLLQTLIVAAKQFDNNGNQKVAKFLTNFALQLGELIGSDKQPTVIRKQISDILFKWGHEKYHIGQVVVAFQCWQKCFIIYQTIRDRQGEAASLESLGNAYRSVGEYESSIAAHQRALHIQKKIKNRQGEANSLGNLGNVCLSLGDYQQAITYYKKSLAISRKIKDLKGKATSLGNLGIAYNCLGDYKRAIDYHEKSLVISQKINDCEGEATAWGNLGNACHCLGNYEQAITHHKKSLAIYRQIKYRFGEGRSLGNLGNAHYSLGEYQEAIFHYEHSLAIQREIKDCQGEATALGNLGNVYHFQGKDEEAISYHKEHLQICQEIKDRRGEATALGNIGNAYESLGEYEKALDQHEKSLAISREIKNRSGEAGSLNNIGNAYRELQQTQKAIDNYRDCLKIAIPETMPDICFRAAGNLGEICFTQGDWHLALEGYEPAMQAVEQLRKGSTTDKRRQEIIKEAISVYANAVQCYINLKQYDKAVETADRSRSRHLADLFASKDLYPQGEIPPEVEEYYRLQEQINRLRSSDNEGTKPLAITRQQIPNDDAIIAKIKELEKEKKKAWQQIRSKDEVLAGQLQPELLYVKDMQTLIPDAETAILNFYTTNQHTHIFILRQNQLNQLHTCEGQGLETLQHWLFDNWLKPYKENQTVWRNQMGEFLGELANRLKINQLIALRLSVPIIGRVLYPKV